MTRTRLPVGVPIGNRQPSARRQITEVPFDGVNADGVVEFEPVAARLAGMKTDASRDGGKRIRFDQTSARLRGTLPPARRPAKRQDLAGRARAITGWEQIPVDRAARTQRPSSRCREQVDKRRYVRPIHGPTIGRDLESLAKGRSQLLPMRELSRQTQTSATPLLRPLRDLGCSGGVAAS